MMERLGYKILVKDNSDATIGIVLPIKDLRFGKRLNNYGEASFKIQVDDAEVSNLISLRSNYIEIYRSKYTDLEYLLQEDGFSILQENGDSLILEQSGFQYKKVWSGEQASFIADLTDDGDSWLDVKCFGWCELLKHRFTSAEVSFDDIDQGQIAWSLINTTNIDDDTGITQGSIPTTKIRDRTYYNQNIMEAIINLSGVVSGFDFEITDDRVFNVYDVKGTDRTGEILFEYGHNIRSVVIGNNFNDPVTRGIVLGIASGQSTLQRVERDDAGLQTAYGLREGVMQEMDVSILSTLQDKGDAMIQKYGVPLIEISFELIGNTYSIDQFGVGDLIRLRVNRGIFNIDTDYRVFEWEISVEDDGSERLSLILGTFTI